MSEPLREPRPQSKVETDPKGEELRVLDQKEGSDIQPTVESSRALVKHLLGRIQQQKEEMNQAKPLWRRAFESARQWLSKEQSIEEKLVRLEIDLQHAGDQLDHASAEHAPTVAQQITVLHQQIETILATLPPVELPADQTAELIEEQYTIQTAGASKRRAAGEFKPNQLGRFGQDLLRVDRVHGSVVVADGISTAPDSYEVARRVSLAAERLLRSIPEQLTTEVDLTKWLTERIPTLLNATNDFDGFGATTLLASRYLPWCDRLVTIDIGDCQQVLLAGNTVEALQPKRKHTNAPDNLSRNRGKSELRNKSTEPLVRVVSLQAYRERYPGAKLRLLQATDGIENNTGKTLAEVAEQFIDQDVEVVLEQFNHGKDDLTVAELTLPAEVVQQTIAA